jgi:ferredoxin/flavodoxin---NADP+ reductase
MIENNATVMKVEQLPDCLFRIWIKPDWDVSSIDWLAGQFLRLGIIEEGFGKNTLRAMTIIDVVDGVFEFFMVAVSNGITSPRVSMLRCGDRCYLEHQITGNFTLRNVPIKEGLNLWMFGTGTGIAPYLAMLNRESSALQKCNHIVLVHSVRSDRHLCYKEEISKYAKTYTHFQYVPVVTRMLTTKVQKCLRIRIPQILLQGKLYEFTNIQIHKQDTFVMLCGDPGMIQESTHILKQMGLKKHRRRTPGEILTERYF